MFFQLLLERDQSWKNKSKLHNVLSLEISLRSHELDSTSCTCIDFVFLSTSSDYVPSQKTDQIYVGKAKHARCNLRTQQKRLTHLLKCVEIKSMFCAKYILFCLLRDECSVYYLQTNLKHLKSSYLGFSLFLSCLCAHKLNRSHLDIEISYNLQFTSYY